LYSLYSLKVNKLTLQSHCNKLEMCRERLQAAGRLGSWNSQETWNGCWRLQNGRRTWTSLETSNCQGTWNCQETWNSQETWSGSFKLRLHTVGRLGEFRSITLKKKKKGKKEKKF
jgi:hypothetical protein